MALDTDAIYQENPLKNSPSAQKNHLAIFCDHHGDHHGDYHGDHHGDRNLDVNAENHHSAENLACVI